MLYVDQKYLNLISPRLRNFKRVNKSVAQFSCPFCGDSKRDKRKARCYAYERGGSMLVFCHKCTKSTNLYVLLKQMDTSILAEYQMERFEEEISSAPRVSFTPQEFTEPAPVVEGITSIDLPSCEFLPPSHVAVQTLERRRIPRHRWKDYYHAEDFATWSNTLVPGRYAEPGDARLVLPIWSEEGTLVGYQGRSYGDARSKYLTAALDKSPPFLFGWDRQAKEARSYHGLPEGEGAVPPEEAERVSEPGDSLVRRPERGRHLDAPALRITAVEGPIDSEFVPKGVASAGGRITRELLKTGLPRGRFVVAYDNEPRSAVTVQKIESAIADGFPVFIWPVDVVEKDFNDFVMQMMNKGSPLELALSRIEQMITERTFTGMEAELELLFWKKV